MTRSWPTTVIRPQLASFTCEAFGIRLRIMLSICSLIFMGGSVPIWMMTSFASLIWYGKPGTTIWKIAGPPGRPPRAGRSIEISIRSPAASLPM